MGDKSREIDEGEREAAHVALREHFAAGHLSVESLDARTSLVEHAATAGDLQRALASLPPLGDHALVPADRTRVLARLSSTDRAGTWTLPPELDVVAHAGRVVIDLRDAHFMGDTEIRVNVMLGAVHFLVHADQPVQLNGRATLGTFAHLEQRGSDRGPQHAVRIGGHALLGRVSVEVHQRQSTGLFAQLQKLLPRR